MELNEIIETTENDSDMSNRLTEMCDELFIECIDVINPNQTLSAYG